MMKLYFSLKESAGTMALILTKEKTLTQLESWLLTRGAGSFYCSCFWFLDVLIKALEGANHF